jgi:metal-responsive CopG/Arc/MetJ family transcriptional regulator
MNSAKVAISIPAALLHAVEQVRRREGLSRSAVFAEAVETWLGSRNVSDEDRRYVDGYLRKPERSDEIAAVAAAAVTTWDPWT